MNPTIFLVFLHSVMYILREANKADFCIDFLVILHVCTFVYTIYSNRLSSADFKSIEIFGIYSTVYEFWKNSAFVFLTVHWLFFTYVKLCFLQDARVLISPLIAEILYFLHRHFDSDCVKNNKVIRAQSWIW